MSLKVSPFNDGYGIRPQSLSGHILRFRNEIGKPGMTFRNNVPSAFISAETLGFNSLREENHTFPLRAPVCNATAGFLSLRTNRFAGGGALG